MQFHVICFLNLSVLEKYVFSAEDCSRRTLHVQESQKLPYGGMGLEDPNGSQSAMIGDFKSRVHNKCRLQPDNKYDC